ncbi:hypothetical protein [Nocardioides sp.]|uniref:hypothetical protein n=1 Tax=Nocardioides sp. TaxID=35761 RepID=UPI0037843C48
MSIHLSLHDRSTRRSTRAAARRSVAVVAVVLTCVAGAAGCGSSDAGSDAGPAAGSSAAAEPKVIDVTVEGDSVTPSGERVEVEVGQPVTLHVTADAPGEIHVHSSPEQELEYEQGETDLELTPITTPGTVDVESHTLDKVIVQLEVS